MCDLVFLGVDKGRGVSLDTTPSLVVFGLFALVHGRIQPRPMSM